MKEAALGHGEPGVPGRSRCSGRGGVSVKPLGPFKAPPPPIRRLWARGLRAVTSPLLLRMRPAAGGAARLRAVTSLSQGACAWRSGGAEGGDGGCPGALVLAGLPRRQRALPEQAGDLPGGLAAAPHLR